MRVVSFAGSWSSVPLAPLVTNDGHGVGRFAFVYIPVSSHNIFFYDDGHCFLPADDGGEEEDCYHSSLLSWNDPDLS